MYRVKMMCSFDSTSTSYGGFWQSITVISVNAGFKGPCVD